MRDVAPLFAFKTVAAASHNIAAEKVSFNTPAFLQYLVLQNYVTKKIILETGRNSDPSILLKKIGKRIQSLYDFSRKIEGDSAFKVVMVFTPT